MHRLTIYGSEEMPYRARGNFVQKKKKIRGKDRWVSFKRHPTPARAKAHAAALNIGEKNNK